MKSSRRFFSLGALTIALVAGTFFLVIAPANRRRDALQADSEQKLAALVRLNDGAAASSSINAKITGVRGTIASFESKLHPARQLNRIVEDIWQSAEANGLHARTLKTSAGKRMGSYWAQDMDFSLAGSFSAFRQFLLQLEQSPAPVRIARWTMNRIAGRDADMQVDMTLGLLLWPEPIAVPGSMANVAIDQR